MSSEVTEQRSREVAEQAREQQWEKPSFGRELFMGRLRLDLIQPYPKPTPEQKRRGEAFLQRLEDFCRREVDPLRIEREARIPQNVIDGLAKIGAFGIKIDEKYGGLGLSQVYYNRALMLAGSAHSSLSTLLSAHQSIGVPQPLKIFGTPEQKQKYLPRLARGEISAFLLTEPDVGSDPARLGTTAVPTDDGSAYVLNGLKLWATNGAIADILVVMANVPRSEGHEGGITAFIVEAKSDGIQVEHRNEFMGLRGIENSVTSFKDVKVPRENMIGGEGRGLKIALVTLNTGRLSLPAIAASSTKASLTIVREWANERVQWGKPIGKHEAMAHKIAFIAGVNFAAEAVVELSGALADQERNDIRIEAALAKLWTSEMACLAADEMVQVRGGRGFETAESMKRRGEKAVPAEQILRDLRITRIFEGSTEIMRLFIAREAVDQHFSLATPIMDPRSDRSTKLKGLARATGFYARWLPALTVGRGAVPRSFSQFGALGPHMQFVERTSRKLARTTFYGMSIWQARLEYKQGFLGRIVDIGAELYAMSAACVYAGMLEQEGGPGASTAAELADLFCRFSRRRVRRLFHELWHNDDSRYYSAAQRVLEGRYEWSEAGVIDLYNRDGGQTPSIQPPAAEPAPVLAGT